jgi:hypothetical protein
MDASVTAKAISTPVIIDPSNQESRAAVLAVFNELDADASGPLPPPSHDAHDLLYGRQVKWTWWSSLSSATSSASAMSTSSSRRKRHPPPSPACHATQAREFCYCHCHCHCHLHFPPLCAGAVETNVLPSSPPPCRRPCSSRRLTLMAPGISALRNSMSGTLTWASRSSRRRPVSKPMPRCALPLLVYQCTHTTRCPGGRGWSQPRRWGCGPSSHEAARGRRPTQCGAS